MATKLNVKGMDKVTPKGLGQWVKVDEADNYGNLTANLVCNPSDKEVQDFKLLIDSMVEKVKQETGKKKILLPYSEDDEGNLVFKTKVKEQGKEGKVVVKVVDSAKNDIEGVLIGNGSTIKLLVRINPYDMGANTGVSLRLKKVQLLNLVEYGEDFGTEDGYVADAPTASKQATNDAISDDEDF